MDIYFQKVLGSLTIDDMCVLGVLEDLEANTKFKALKKKTLAEKAELSEANLRKVIYRLEALQFIEIVSGSKDHRIFITEYGQEALHNSLYKGGI